jgi:chromate reductase
MYPINKPEIFITFAGQKFDKQGRLTDEKTREFITVLLETRINLSKRLAK